MKCNICDKTLSESEVVFNKELNDWEPCTTCLDIALDAAYSEGFSPDDNDTDPVYGSGAVETLEYETFRSTTDRGDISFVASGHWPSED